MRLVGEGYVSPEDLDKTVAHGLGLRWSFMGPFATIELNAPGGVADYCARYAASIAASPPIRRRPSLGPRPRGTCRARSPRRAPARRERRMAWRDRRLLALARHKAEQDVIAKEP